MEVSKALTPAQQYQLRAEALYSNFKIRYLAGQSPRAEKYLVELRSLLDDLERTMEMDMPEDVREARVGWSLTPGDDASLFHGNESEDEGSPGAVEAGQLRADEEEVARVKAFKVAKALKVAKELYQQAQEREPKERAQAKALEDIKKVEAIRARAVADGLAAAVKADQELAELDIQLAVAKRALVDLVGSHEDNPWDFDKLNESKASKSKWKSLMSRLSPLRSRLRSRLLCLVGLRRHPHQLQEMESCPPEDQLIPKVT